jgi:hypothetical protein
MWLGGGRGCGGGEGVGGGRGVGGGGGWGEGALAQPISLGLSSWSGDILEISFQSSVTTNPIPNKIF